MLHLRDARRTAALWLEHRRGPRQRFDRVQQSAGRCRGSDRCRADLHQQRPLVVTHVCRSGTVELLLGITTPATGERPPRRPAKPVWMANRPYHRSLVAKSPPVGRSIGASHASAPGGPDVRRHVEPRGRNRQRVENWIAFVPASTLPVRSTPAALTRAQCSSREPSSVGASTGPASSARLQTEWKGEEGKVEGRGKHGQRTEKTLARRIRPVRWWCHKRRESRGGGLRWRGGWGAGKEAEGWGGTRADVLRTGPQGASVGTPSGGRAFRGCSTSAQALTLSRHPRSQSTERALRGPKLTRPQPSVDDYGRVFVELGGIEPPSIRRLTPVLRPFPTLPLTQRDRRVGWPPVYPVARALSFRRVIGLSRRHRSFPTSSPASVAGLRWIGPVRHFWSRCLFTT